MLHRVHQHSLRPGHQLLWYRIDQVLGHGATGITYLASDGNLGRRVAIKEYLPSDIAMRDNEAWVRPMTPNHKADYQAGLDRFIREGQILDRFEHPNIVRVLNVFETGNTAYMVMAYERGQNLRDILNHRQVLGEQEILPILLPILDGLEAVHEQGFIHRDVKPSNIFVRDDGSPVLLDFGSARYTDIQPAHTVTNFVSPGYAPIEQYASKTDQQGPWTDIYGLGATLYRAVCGIAPLPATDRSAGIVNGEGDLLIPGAEAARSPCSGRLLRAVDHALRFKAGDRPQSIDAWRSELGDDLIRVAELRPRPAPRLPPSDTERVPTRVVYAHGNGDQDTALGYFTQLAERCLPGFKILLLAGLVLASLIAVTRWSQQPAAPPLAAAAPAPPVAAPDPRRLELARARARLDAALHRIDRRVAAWKQRRQAPPPPAGGPLPFADAARVLFGEPTAGATPVLAALPPIDTFADAARRVAAFAPAGMPAKAAPKPRPRPRAGAAADPIAALLGQAEGDIRRARLSTPPGANALEKYREVLRRDPGNRRAQRGIERVVAEYLRLMRHAGRTGADDRARHYLARAESIAPQADAVRRARAALPPREPQRYAASRPALSAESGSRLNHFLRKLGLLGQPEDR